MGGPGPPGWAEVPTSPDASIEALRFIRRYVDRDPAADFSASLSGEATTALMECMTGLLRALAHQDGHTGDAEARAYIHRFLDDLIQDSTLSALAGDGASG